jgi:DNA-binding transcriptional LysR family regulator
VRLFDRNTLRVVLSGVGEEFYPLTERVLRDLDVTVLGLTNLKEKRRGVVRIAAPEVMSCTLVPAAMEDMHGAVPGPVPSFTGLVDALKTAATPSQSGRPRRLDEQRC